MNDRCLRYIYIQFYRIDQQMLGKNTQFSYGSGPVSYTHLDVYKRQGVDKALEKKEGATDAFSQIGAGDQGMMFGYACNETEELMPLPISLAHRRTKKLSEVRRADEHSLLLPDGKSQVTVEYDDDNNPVRVDTVVISVQHRAEASLDELRPYIIEKVIKTTIPEHLIDEHTRYLINPTGRFVIGGPQGDTGLTGRKIIVDTYGGMARHGGGAFSGKDPTKVDRSAAYLSLIHI